MQFIRRHWISTHSTDAQMKGERREEMAQRRKDKVEGFYENDTISRCFWVTKYKILHYFRPPASAGK